MKQLLFILLIHLTTSAGFAQNNMCYSGSDSLLTSISTTLSVSCHGACDASASVSAIYGSGAYVYSWTSTNGFSSSQAAVSGLCPGKYFIDVSDSITGLACEDSIIITEPDLLIVNHAIVNGSCSNACDGLIEIIPFGGTGPYSITGSNGMAQNNVTSVATFGNLCDGSYIFDVTDAHGCVTTVGPLLITSNGFTASAYTVQNEISGCDGIVDVNINGGSGPFQVSWYDCATGNYVGLGLTTLGNLCDGDYYAVVTNGTCSDTTGCTTVYDSTNCNVFATYQSTPDSCGTACSGTITVTATGGTAPYVFILNGLVTMSATSSITFTGLCSGIYQIEVYDDNNCYYFYPTASVGAGNSISVLQNGMTDETFSGAQDGTLTFGASGGISPYSYSLTGVGVNSIGVFTGLSTGWYEICVTDIQGCMQCDSAFVGLDSLPCNNLVATYAIVDESCSGSCDGLIEIIPSGGTAPYTIGSSNGMVQNNVTSVATFGNLCAGTYIFDIIDANGCVTTVGPLLISSNGFTASAYTVQNEISGCDGIVDVNINGGSGPFQVSWYDCATGNYVGLGLTTLGNLCDGDYYAVVTNGTCSDTTGCTTVYDSTNCNHIVLENITHNYCPGMCDGTIVLTSTGPNPTYIWDNGTTGSYISGLCDGTYCVTVQYSDGCLETHCYTVTTNSTLSLLAQVGNESAPGVTDGYVVLSGSGGTGGYEFSIDGGLTWMFGSNPHTMGNLSAGNYIVCVKDSSGCELCDSTVIGVGTGLQAFLDLNIEVYPNPNNGAFTIVLPSELIGNTHLSLRDALGRLVYDEINSNQKINVNVSGDEISAGLYLLTVKHGSYQENVRLIIR